MHIFFHPIEIVTNEPYVSVLKVFPCTNTLVTLWFLLHYATIRLRSWVPNALPLYTPIPSKNQFFRIDHNILDRIQCEGAE